MITKIRARCAAVLALSLFFLALLAGCERGEPGHPSPVEPTETATPSGAAPEPKSGNPPGDEPGARRQIAILAGGCFWGMEELLRQQPGVIDTSVGYAGGTLAKPGYDDVKTGRSGHAESVQVTFDPAQTSYESILEYFFSIHDPTTHHRQGNDVGSQYRSAIFVLDAEQRRVAEAVMAKVTASGYWKQPLTTEVVEATAFYPAEGYHQDYLQKNPGGYTCHFERPTPFH